MNKGKKGQLPVIKGNPLFQIIPQGMNDDEDDFAALGAEQDDEEIEHGEQEMD